MRAWKFTCALRLTRARLTHGGPLLGRSAHSGPRQKPIFAAPVFASGGGPSGLLCASGADVVADDDETLKKIEGGMTDFDVAIPRHPI